ncbi:zwei Ig domain protein zig-8-like [Anopheles ziemanni]|uniref:zwei Ig domain protein zig-8-like n=1 Tax=Anopheles coustani TaxID=139045 RepID=UPI00265892CA|nr:zwei Ig domain protein zig-8-like [Anopheles coustani]XP_058178284.1 zwei Ig domain protein zig-8-like [Anopheles ziemanni]
MHTANVLRASCIFWVSFSSNLMLTTTNDESDTLQPYFDFDVTRNLTITVGQTGFLHCRVERLGDKDVAWIRKRDLHILTMGPSTYTSDQRFQLLRPANSANWTLQIKYPQTRDSGVYECQINTEPKLSLSYVLNVIELRARILGPSDIFIKSGSEITIVCVIQRVPHELGLVFWYKGSSLLESHTQENNVHPNDEGRITIETDWTDVLTSRLKIKRAVQSDSGNYTCVPTMAKSASVYAHVISEEHPAAMQHNAAAPVRNAAHLQSMCILLVLHMANLLYLHAGLALAAFTRSAATRHLRQLRSVHFAPERTTSPAIHLHPS